MSTQYDGEALVADLGDGKYIFVTIDRNTSLGRAIAVETGRLSEQHDSHKGAAAFVKRSRGEIWEVPESLIPRLVTFEDIDDVSTFIYVDPQDLEAVFGPGYALESTRFSVTTEPITKGRIEPVLNEWLKVFSAPSALSFVRRTAENGVEIQRIDVRDFWAGSVYLDIRERHR